MEKIFTEKWPLLYNKPLHHDYWWYTQGLTQQLFPRMVQDAWLNTVLGKLLKQCAPISKYIAEAMLTHVDTHPSVRITLFQEILKISDASKRNPFMPLLINRLSGKYRLATDIIPRRTH